MKCAYYHHQPTPLTYKMLNLTTFFFSMNVKVSRSIPKQPV